MRTYQSVNFGIVSFLKKAHFTKDGWEFLKKQVGAPVNRFNDGGSTVDFEAINVIFKTPVFDFNHPETMTMGFRYREGDNPGWTSKNKKRR